MKTTSMLSTVAALAMLGAAASAQSTIYALDFRGARFVKTDETNFLGNLTVIGPNANTIYGIDFDQTATTLWGVENATLTAGTFDLTTGAFNAVGPVTGPIAGSGATGLTCDRNGVWYLSQYDLPTLTSSLYKGDVTTGVFTLVGPIVNAIIIDISIDSQGNL